MSWNIFIAIASYLYIILCLVFNPGRISYHNCGHVYIGMTQYYQLSMEGYKDMVCQIVVTIYLNLKRKSIFILKLQKNPTYRNPSGGIHSVWIYKRFGYMKNSCWVGGVGTNGYMKNSCRVGGGYKWAII